MTLQRCSVLAVVSSLTLACSSSSGSSPGPTGAQTAASGSVTVSAPADAEVAVIWAVSATSPDYSFHFGDGTLNGASFTVSLPSAPPAEALNEGVLGVGVVALFPPGTSIPVGKVDSATLGTVLGATMDRVIIFRGNGQPVVDWLADFPVGYACGVCVPASQGFDSFAPTDCSSLVLGPVTSNGCNWT